jgi:hypothetical protein
VSGFTSHSAAIAARLIGIPSGIDPRHHWQWPMPWRAPVANLGDLDHGT